MEQILWPSEDPVALMVAHTCVLCQSLCVCMRAYTNGFQKRALDTMELDQVIVSLLIQVLGN